MNKPVIHGTYRVRVDKLENGRWEPIKTSEGNGFACIVMTDPDAEGNFHTSNSVLGDISIHDLFNLMLNQYCELGLRNDDPLPWGRLLAMLAEVDLPATRMIQSVTPGQLIYRGGDAQ